MEHISILRFQKIVDHKPLRLVDVHTQNDRSRDLKLTGTELLYSTLRDDATRPTHTMKGLLGGHRKYSV